MLVRSWRKFWMRLSGIGLFGRFCTRLAALGAPRHKDRVFLSRLSPKGYSAPSAIVQHNKLTRGKFVFIDDDAVLFQRQRKGQQGGEMIIGDRVCIYRSAILETGFGGKLRIGKGSSIHPRCQINAYVSEISIGNDVMLAPNCALYSYDHQTKLGQPISQQPLVSRGGIVIEDEVWLGVGATIMDGVTIGQGAVVAANAVVTKDVPSNAIVSGVPARVIGFRSSAD